MKHRWKRVAALLGAALIMLGALAACSPEEKSSATAEQENQIVLENDGSATTLVVAEQFISEERTQALQEIAQKYQADYPETKIEIRTLQSEEEVEQALRDGDADLVELTKYQQPGCVADGLLVDLFPYMEVWEESSYLTASAKYVVASMGSQRTYLLPATTHQNLIYYRSDWFEEYNQDKEEGLVYCRQWQDLTDAAEKLADKGAKGLVFGGKDGLVDLFDSAVWSAVSLGRMGDSAASYLSSVEGHDTLFTLEQTVKGVDQIADLMGTAVSEETLNYTEDQAVDAFIEGKAITLIAGQDQMDKIAASMEEGSWSVAAYPRGITGTAITSLDFTGFGVASATENPGNAIHFLTYLSNGDNNTHLAKVCGTVPIHTTAASMEPALEETDLAINLLMVRRADWYYYAQEPLMYEAYEGYRDWANDLLREYLTGQCSQEELLSQLDAYWSQARADQGELWKTEESEES